MRVLFLSTLSLVLVASDPAWRTLNAEARRAVEAKDYALLKRKLLALRPLLPGNPRILYNLAAAEAVLAEHGSALARLRELAATGLYYDLSKDADFSSIRSRPEFADIQQRLNRNRDPIITSTHSFPIPGSDLIPEDIAWDPVGRRFLISSVRERRIVDSVGTVFAESEWPILALAVDAQRNLLWATTGWMAVCRGCNEGNKDQSAAVAFDLKTRRVTKRINSPVPGLLGDIAISRGGDLYLSESSNGAVLRLKEGGASMDRLDAAGEFPSPQGLVLSADERTLYIADYVRGIAGMELESRSVRWLQPAPGIALNGIDGLRLFDNSFIAVQNGVNPGRIIRVSLDLQRQEVLESGSKAIGEATHGTIRGQHFYFLANTGWDAWDNTGRKKADMPPVLTTVRQIRLNPKF